MNAPIRATLVLAAACVTSGMQAPQAPALAAGLTITHAARQVAPGEVVLLTITGTAPLTSVTGTAFGQRLAAFPGDAAGADGARDTAGSTRVWQALAGIDLGTAAGVSTVSVEARTVDGAVVRGSHRLTVAPKKFGVRRLRVPEQFVTPPASALARIAREQKRLAEVYAAVSPSRLWRGAFERPTDGAPVSQFGVRSDYNGKQGTPHRGTDFAGAAGAPVRAPAAGRVVLAMDLYYSGNTLILDHGLGLFSVLMHLSRIDVKDGDVVAAGAGVGAVGATGRVTGPHLHWSVRIGPVSVDPLSLLALTP